MGPVWLLVGESSEVWEQQQIFRHEPGFVRGTHSNTVSVPMDCSPTVDFGMYHIMRLPTILDLIMWSSLIITLHLIFTSFIQIFLDAERWSF